MHTVKFTFESKRKFQDFQLDGESANDSIVRLLDSVEEEMLDLPKLPAESVTNINVSSESLNRLKKLKLHNGESLQDVILRAISLYTD